MYLSSDNKTSDRTSSIQPVGPVEVFLPLDFAVPFRLRVSLTALAGAEPSNASRVQACSTYPYGKHE